MTTETTTATTTEADQALKAKHRAMWALALSGEQAGRLLRQRLEKGPTDTHRSLRVIEVLERMTFRLV